MGVAGTFGAVGAVLAAASVKPWLFIDAFAATAGIPTHTQNRRPLTMRRSAGMRNAVAPRPTMRLPDERGRFAQLASATPAFPRSLVSCWIETRSRNARQSRRISDNLVSEPLATVDVTGEMSEWLKEHG
jgi:hypothetical protein